MTKHTSQPRRARRAALGLWDGIGRLPVAAKIGLAFAVLIVLVGVFAPLLARQDPTEIGLGRITTGPDTSFWFGLDRLGRDVYSRVIAGTRRSLEVGFGSTLIALVVGSILGAVAATSRKAVDEVVMRALDVIMAFPAIVLAALVVIGFGKNNFAVVVIAIGFVFIPQIARVVRANVAGQYGEDYVAAEQIIGATRSHILIRHVVRNTAAPVLVFATVIVAQAIVFEAGLSFIGAGLQPEEGTSSWGSVIAYGQQLLATHGWWATFFPGLAILLTVLALNLLSEGISDVWAAPVARRGTSESVEQDEAEMAKPGDRGIVQLPGLASAADRLAARARPVAGADPLLAVEDLRVSFADRHNGVDIIDGISFSVQPGEVRGLVGESGCGKSLTALTVMGLQPAGARVSGSVRFQGANLLAMRRRERRALMGRQIAMIYQDALSALNPAMTVSAQLKQLTRRGGTRTPGELMGLVGLDAKRTLRAYPHELSGGQRQRVVIAMALSRDPQLVIADEPTTALDVTIQAQVIDLLLRLREELGFALVLVSHDLALLSSVVDRVTVMYGGQIAETGAVADVVRHTAHHYARGLLGSVLSLESGAARLTQIPGVVPTPADFPTGCRFADRCPAATEVCREVRPELEGTELHRYACHHPAVGIDDGADSVLPAESRI